MPKSPAINGLIVLGVVAGVAGVAWYRSAGDAPSRTPAVATSAVAPLDLPRVVDVGADKCQACKDLAPILAELRKEYAGRVSVEFVDSWKNPSAADLYQVRIIPTQIFFNADGEEVWRHEGFLSKAEFIAKFAEMGVK